MSSSPRSRSYEQELALLPQTYVKALGADPSSLRSVVQSMGGRPAYFVGSGGAFAVARLAAGSYERAFRVPVRACTPLEFLAVAPTTSAGVVLFSSSGKNKDSIATLKHAQAGAFAPACVVTMRKDPIPLPNGRGIRQVVLDAPSLRDGFLATNSVLFMATAWLRALGFEKELASELPTAGHLDRTLRNQCVILSAPGLEAIATDLETRLAEVGLATAQIADYRNFAHGRHFGFSHNIDATTIVALRAAPYAGLAQRTLDLLPDGADVVSLETTHEWPMSAIDLLHKTMTLILASASKRAIRVARPGVPSFGRQLYNLNYVRLLPKITNGPVEKKLAATGLPEHDGHVRELLNDRCQNWLAHVHEADFDALVLDYDGTVCSTDDRGNPPHKDIQLALVAVLEAGVGLAFATGRGDSLCTSLREWVPQPLWGRVVLGLYNSSVVVNLDEDFVARNSSGGAAARIAALLRTDPLVSECKMKVVDHQIRLECASHSFVSLTRLSSHVGALLAAHGETEWRALASGHSVDIIPASCRKTHAIDSLAVRGFEKPLLIGDQGDEGGNDFELLASSPFSLTVDRCSADVSRCWNLGLGAEFGPRLLLRYLSAMKIDQGTFRFRWGMRR